MFTDKEELEMIGAGEDYARDNPELSESELMGCTYDLALAWCDESAMGQREVAADFIATGISNVIRERNKMRVVVSGHTFNEAKKLAITLAVALSRKKEKVRVVDSSDDPVEVEWALKESVATVVITAKEYADA